MADNETLQTSVPDDKENKLDHASDGDPTGSSAPEKKETGINYEDREKLDGELMGALNDILSAETEATRIIAKASESVKAIQQDGATRERDMKEQCDKAIAAAHDKAVADAMRRAEAEREKRIEAAKADGEKLFSSKQKDIEKLAKELYAAVGGKG